MTRHYCLSFPRRDLLIIFSIFFCIFISSLVLANTEPFSASLTFQPSPKSPAPVKENITFSVVGGTSGNPCTNEEEYSTNLRWILNSATVSYSNSQAGSSSSVPPHTFSVSPSVGSETTGGSWSCSFQSETAGYWSFSFSATAKIDIYKVVNGQPTNEYIRTETASSSCSATTILVRVNIVVFNLSETDEDNPGAFIGKNRYSATLHYEPITLNQGSLTLSANGVKLFKDYTGNTVSETSWNLASKTPPVYVYFEGTQAPSTGQITWKHSCGAEDSVKITVVEVKLKVDEKSWGQSSWNNPEDAGTYQKEGQERPWYFLWTTDEHRYRAEIKPTNAVNYVTSVTIGSFGNATKNTSGDWELIASNPTTGTYIDTIASATVNGRSCESDSVDIAVHALQSVGWNAVTGGATISGNKIYPEKPSPTANAQKNVNVVARIDRLPSAGMKGTVHLKRLDPMNQCTASVGTTNAVGTAPNDNNGTLNNVDGKTLEFTQGSGINAWVMGTFATAHPGDNYLVAAHQRQSIATSITIDNANPTQVADIVTGKKPVSSSILEVWRSLWAELDQMVLPAGTPAGFPSISGLVSSELEKAHITINSYLPNPRKEVNGQDPSHIINTSHFAQYANPCRDAPQPDI